MSDLPTIIEQVVTEIFAVGPDRQTGVPREIEFVGEDELRVVTNPPALVEPILEKEGFYKIGKPEESTLRYARQEKGGPVEVLELRYGRNRKDPRTWLRWVDVPTTPSAYVEGHPHGTTA